MVSNRRPPVVIRTLSMQLAAQRPDLESDARFHLAASVAALVTNYGLPGTEQLVNPLPPHRK